MNRVARTLDDATSTANEEDSDAKILEFGISLLKAEQDSLKPKKSIGRDLRLVCRKVAVARRKVNSFADGLCRNSFDSGAGIQHNVDQTLLTVGSCQKKLIGRGEKELQRNVHVVFLNAAGGVKESFVGAVRVLDRSLGLIVGHAIHDELARLGISQHVWQIMIDDRVGQVLRLIAEIHLRAIHLEDQRRLSVVRRIFVIVVVNLS